MSHAPHQVVLASAGTGKTTQLAARYIALLARGADPATILATTFTRKAAGEILGRVIGRLAEGAVVPEAVCNVAELRQSGLTAERCRDLTVQLARGMDRLRIMTIDAWLIAIARAFDLEIGLPPGWTIADETDAVLLRSDAAEGAIEGAPIDGVGGLLRALQGGASGRSVHAGVMQAAASASPAFHAAAGEPVPWGVFRAGRPEPNDSEVRSLIDRLRALRMPHTKTDRPDQRWVREHEATIERITRRRWKEALGGGVAKAILDRRQSFYGVEITGGVLETYHALIDAARAFLMTRFENRNAAAHELTARYAAAYDALGGSRRQFGFDDIARALGRAGVAGRLGDVYYRLDGSVRHVLLDEFQDTSLEQFSLLHPLLDEALSHGGDERSVFIVGDAKQSLYSWRGAEPELLGRIGARWPQLAEARPDVNFRSAPVVIDAVNTVFGGLTGNAALAGKPGVREWSDRFSAHKAAKAFAGEVRLIESPADADDAADDALDKAMSTAADRVRAIAEASSAASIAVLLRRRARGLMARMIYKLTRVGLDASQEGGNPLTDSPPVAAALSLLHLAEHPADTACAYHVARSPIGGALGLTDHSGAEAFRRAAGDLRRRLSDDGYATTLKWLQRQTAASMNAHGLMRFEQLVALADEFDGRAGVQQCRFIDLVRARGVEDPTRHRVRVMTIHGAKGLEFDAVVLPDLAGKWANPRGDDVVIDRGAGAPHEAADPPGPVRAATLWPNAMLQRLEPGLAALADRTRARLIGEELSCLYVAMTRAVHVLEMIVPPVASAPRSLTAANVLRAALAAAAAIRPGVLWESSPPGASSWPRWIDDHAPHAPPPAGETLRLEMAKPEHVPLSRARRRAATGWDAQEQVAADHLLAPMAAGARDRGVLMHTWFEAVAWLDEGAPSDDDLMSRAAGAGFPPGEARAALPEFRRMLAGAAAGVLHTAHYRSRGHAAPGPGERDKPLAQTRRGASRHPSELRREWPFAFGDDAADPPIMVTGRFDRVVIGRGGDGGAEWADVVDFKTDRADPRIDPSAAAASLVERYRAQVDTYRRAAAAMLRLPMERVTGTLMFAELGRVVSWT